MLNVNDVVCSERVSIYSRCCEGQELSASAPWKHAVVSDNCCDLRCSAFEFPVIFGNPNVETKPTIVMTNCAHNSVVGLRNRYLKVAAEKLSYDRSLVENILDELCSLLKPHYTGPVTLQGFLAGKKGKLAARYDQAARKVLHSGFNVYKNNKMQAFIKDEIYNEDKPPRMIMGRDPTFNLIYGLFTSSLESCMVQLPQISKGKNFIDRGRQFEELIFGANVLEGDCSKFEGSQRLELLKQVELGIWRRLESPRNYELLVKLFMSKMRKSGFTSNGVYFDFWYCRGSGDMDTGLFNTLLMYVACRYFEIVNGTGNGNFLCDGDDNLIKVPVGHKPLVNTFADFGFDAKLKLCYDYHDASYCSGKFIQYKPGQFIYIQDVLKLINNLPVFRKRKFNHCKTVYYHTLGYMYKVMYGNMPLFSNIANFLLRSTAGKHVSLDIMNEINPEHSAAFRNSRYMLDVDVDVCNVELCMSFSFGMAKLDQMCAWYDRSTISFEKTETKRYNSNKTPHVRLSEIEIEQVYQLLVSGVLTTTPEIYAKRFLSDH